MGLAMAALGIGYCLLQPPVDGSNPGNNKKHPADCNEEGEVVQLVLEKTKS